MWLERVSSHKGTLLQYLHAETTTWRRLIKIHLVNVTEGWLLTLCRWESVIQPMINHGNRMFRILDDDDDEANLFWRVTQTLSPYLWWNLLPYQLLDRGKETLRWWPVPLSLKQFWTWTSVVQTILNLNLQSPNNFEPETPEFKQFWTWTSRVQTILNQHHHRVQTILDHWLTSIQNFNFCIFISLSSLSFFFKNQQLYKKFTNSPAPIGSEHFSDILRLIDRDERIPLADLDPWNLGLAVEMFGGGVDKWLTELFRVWENMLANDMAAAFDGGMWRPFGAVNGGNVSDRKEHIWLSSFKGMMFEHLLTASICWLLPILMGRWPTSGDIRLSSGYKWYNQYIHY